MIAELLPNVVWPEIWQASYDTILMLGFAVFFTVLLGVPLGFWLYLISPRQILDNRALYRILSVVVNIFRSFPTIILIIVMIPLTKFLVGSSYGIKGAIPPLVISAAPFLARLVETALHEVDKGIIEAVQSMGATTRQIIMRALLPEAMPGIIAGITVTAVALVSYGAIAGAIGAGGLGDLSIRYGYQRFMPDVMWVTVFLLVVIVQVVQMTGDYLVRKANKK